MKGRASMPITNKVSIKSKAFFAGLLAAATAMVLIIGLLSPVAKASSLIGVTSNVADVPGGSSFVLTIKAQNDGDIHELEVDHSSSAFPEFSIYADEADPYGGDGALFAAAGVSVTYSAASSEWVIDFGNTTTGALEGADGGAIRFHFVLKDAADNEIWGSMTPATAENTFRFDLLAGTGDSLIAEVEEEDEATDAITPRVPNTSIVR